MGRRPKIDPRVAEAMADALRNFANRAAAAAVNYFTTRRPAAMSLPVNNRYTDMEVTLLGSETCNREYLDGLLADAIADARPGMKADPVVLVLNTEKPSKHLVLLQFRWTLECSAAEAEQSCHDTFRGMVDGQSMLGYAFEVVGVRG